ncbi:putative RNA-directed DNA polymerase [Tanacetum coccineum]
MDFRSLPCLFLGYSPAHHGYRCLDLNTNRLYIARHVRFHEQYFPFLHQSSATPTQSQPDPYFSSFPISCCSPTQSATELGSAPQTAQTHQPATDPQSTQSHQPITEPQSHQPITEPQSTQSPQPVPDPQVAQPHPTESLQPLPNHPTPSASIPPITSTRPAHLRQNPPKTKRYDPSAFHTTTEPIVTEPTTFSVANKDPQWQQAMSEEYRALMKNGTWTLVPPVSNANVVDCKWVYKLKRDQHGAITRYKARLVAKGCNQQAGIDYHETFSPVVKPTTIRVVLSLAVSHGWSLRQLDVQNAFLHGDLRETVYLRQPPGFVDPAKPHHLCLLHKSLYGLKQAPRAWFQRLSKALHLLGFKGSTTDPSLFIHSSAGTFLYMLVYVDDIILIGNNDTAIEHVVKSLSSTFALQDMGPHSYFLGIEVKSNCLDVILSQKQYILEILTKAGLSQSKPVFSPCSITAPLTLGDSPIFDADWAGCPDDHRSTGGFAIYLGSNLVSWSARKQRTVSRSSTESEYKALADTVAELTWLESLLRELRVPVKSIPILWCDNLGATYLSANPIFHARMKHVEVDFHFVREKVAQGRLSVQFISTHDQIADVFTKPLPTDRFVTLRDKLQLVSHA